MEIFVEEPQNDDDILYRAAISFRDQNQADEENYTFVGAEPDNRVEDPNFYTALSFHPIYGMPYIVNIIYYIIIFIFI